MLEHILDWLRETLEITIHYQHLVGKPGEEFAWCVISGEEFDDDLDGDNQPDTVYFDLEVYAETASRSRELADALRNARDFRGLIADGAAYVDDIAIENQRDGYEQQINAESLPQYFVPFLLTVTGYQPTGE